MAANYPPINIEVRVTWFSIDQLASGHPLLKLPAVLADGGSGEGGKSPPGDADSIPGVLVFAGNVTPSSELPENCPFTRKDRVLGITKPFKNVLAAVSDECIVTVNAFQCVRIPPEVSPSLAIVAVLPALRTLAALEQAGKTLASDEAKGSKSVLVVAPQDANQALITVQVCTMYGMEPTIWLLNEEQKEQFSQASSETQALTSADVMVMDEYMAETELPARCLARTGNRGMDLVVNVPKCHLGSSIVGMQTLIRCLAIQGHLVTTYSRQQLTADNQESLHLKSSSVHFLCELTYLLSPLQIGTYQDMISSVMHCLRDKLILPILPKVQDVKWSSAAEAKPAVLKGHKSSTFGYGVVMKLS